MTTRALPVIMPSIPGQKWSCHSCGNCCRTLVVHLFKEDRERLDHQGWTKRFAKQPYLRAGRGWVLSRGADGACIFLDDENRCLIHARYGEDAKPLACRLFPFSVRATKRGWQASLRFDCPSVAASKGRSLQEARSWLTDLLARFEYPDSPGSDAAYLKGGIRGSKEELEAVTHSFVRFIKREEMPFPDRLVSASRITADLSAASLEKVRGKRLAELVDLFCGAASTQYAQAPNAPTARQCGMLRQLVFAHAEHVSLDELGSGALWRLRKRIQQLRAARRFLKGAGLVPGVGGWPDRVSFSAVEAVRFAPQADGAMEDMLTRYLIARLSGRSVFGSGYYGWPVFAGLTALWLSIAVVGWVARLSAAGDGRESISLDDVSFALGVVDRSATRMPVLGTTAERARVLYLSGDDGVARLIRRYAVTNARP